MSAVRNTPAAESDYIEVRRLVGQPANEAVRLKPVDVNLSLTRQDVDRRDDLAHRIREAWQKPGVIRYDSDDEWRMAVAAADVALGRDAQ